MARTKKIQPDPIPLTPAQRAQRKLDSAEVSYEGACIRWIEKRNHVVKTLRRMADDIERLDQASYPETKAHKGTAIVREIMWGVANMNLDTLVDAGMAWDDTLRRVGEAQKNLDTIPAGERALAQVADLDRYQEEGLVFEECKKCERPQNECDCE